MEEYYILDINLPFVEKIRKIYGNDIKQFIIDEQDLRQNKKREKGILINFIKKCYSVHVLRIFCHENNY
jgi:hypothetical protein